jgi:Holliday junction DNA helicase RuvA
MIAHLHGTLLCATPSYAILEAAGVGYRVFITAVTFSRLPSVNTSCRLWTAHIIREQSQALYGFIQQSECDLFETLLNVNGIGPKLALSILGHFTPAEFSQALLGGDTTALGKVPGVGKKMAQRLVVEMSGVKRLEELQLSGGDGAPIGGALQRQAVSALQNLGYNEQAASKAVKKCLQIAPESQDLGALIAAALQQI